MNGGYTGMSLCKPISMDFWALFLGVAEVSQASHLNVETEPSIKWCGGGNIDLYQYLSTESSSHLIAENEPSMINFTPRVTYV